MNKEKKIEKAFSKGDSIIRFVVSKRILVNVEIKIDGVYYVGNVQNRGREFFENKKDVFAIGLKYKRQYSGAEKELFLIGAIEDGETEPTFFYSGGLQSGYKQFCEICEGRIILNYLYAVMSGELDNSGNLSDKAKEWLLKNVKTLAYEIIYNHINQNNIY